MTGKAHEPAHIASYDARMYAEPAGFDRAELARALLSGWGVEVARMRYEAVGFGTHHYRVRAVDGTDWFVNVDVLARMARPAPLPERRGVTLPGRGALLLKQASPEGEPGWGSHARAVCQPSGGTPRARPGARSGGAVAAGGVRGAGARPVHAVADQRRGAVMGHRTTAPRGGRPSTPPRAAAGARGAAPQRGTGGGRHADDADGRGGGGR